MTDLPPHVTAGSVDLHAHSTASDGLLSPAELVAEAARRGVRVLALTDHDTLAGLPAATAAAADHGIELVPGVELSSEAGKYEIHVLGYYVDPTDAALTAELAGHAAQRRTRADRVVERLSALGLPVSLDRVIELAAGGTIGRPHVARAMIEAGYVTTVGEAFDRYLANGQPAYVPRDNVPPEEAVALLSRAGAIPVLAHPFSTGDVEGTLRRLVPHGLRGIEVYYGEYNPERRMQLRAIADAWSLLPTGGSDYHGPAFKEGRDLGSVPVPAEVVHRLRAARPVR